MRIITGSARGVALETLDGIETRPTTERVKEALFSMIQFDIEGRRVLDLFAGSGQLGLEALSRGAQSALFIDSSREACNIIAANAEKAKLIDKCRISTLAYNSYLKAYMDRDKFDIIFLDPPYNSGYIPIALSSIADGKMLTTNGVIVCETDTPPTGKKRRNVRESKDFGHAYDAVLKDVFGGDAELFEKFRLIKTNSYGRVRITLLTNAE